MRQVLHCKTEHGALALPCPLCPQCIPSKRLLYAVYPHYPPHPSPHISHCLIPPPIHSFIHCFVPQCLVLAVPKRGESMNPLTIIVSLIITTLLLYIIYHIYHVYYILLVIILVNCRLRPWLLPLHFPVSTPGRPPSAPSGSPLSHPTLSHCLISSMRTRTLPVLLSLYPLRNHR